MATTSFGHVLFFATKIRFDDQNPVENLKVLYGIGALRLNDKTGKGEWIGGVKYTIKDGIVYDAKQLLADVARMVEEQRKKMPATNEDAARP